MLDGKLDFFSYVIINFMKAKKRSTNGKNADKLVSIYKKFRKKNSLFVIEGERIVREVLTGGALIDQILISESFPSSQSTFLDTRSKYNATTKIIPDNQMKTISGTVTPSGILALCKMPEQPNLKVTKEQNILYLDTIQDPGN